MCCRIERVPPFPIFLFEGSKDVTEAYGCQYYSCAVGEVNASTMMQKVNAVIGGEGNGGVIVPDFHYGRDALIGQHSS